eukprot:9427532-Pyramimonas_sp.AAC.2
MTGSIEGLGAEVLGLVEGIRVDGGVTRTLPYSMHHRLLRHSTALANAIGQIACLSKPCLGPATTYDDAAQQGGILVGPILDQLGMHATED